jgi:tetratricopeptide (TPR) repeat protein
MSKEEELEILKKGLAINPASFRLRAYYLLGITPRWGGSYEQMDAFATEAQSYAANNPKIACLRGYAYYDAGDMKIINHDYTAAFALLNKAMTYGKDPLFLRDRASVYGHMQKPAEALKDIDLAIALYPNDVEEYFIRAELLGTQGRLEEALRDIETGDSIESNKPESERHKRWVSDMLTYSGYQLLQKKDVQGAMGMFNLAVRIGPENESAYYCRAMAYVNKNDMDTAYSDLQKAIELKPDYFKAYYYLDNYVLSKRKDWVKIISYWDKYIALHPEDARAYVERSGAYYYSHNLEAALRDAKHAADLGNENGKRIYEKYKKGVKMD